MNNQNLALTVGEPSARSMQVGPGPASYRTCGCRQEVRRRGMKFFDQFLREAQALDLKNCIESAKHLGLVSNNRALTVTVNRDDAELHAIQTDALNTNLGNVELTIYGYVLSGHFVLAQIFGPCIGYVIDTFMQVNFFSSYAIFNFFIGHAFFYLAVSVYYLLAAELHRLSVAHQLKKINDQPLQKAVKLYENLSFKLTFDLAQSDAPTRPDVPTKFELVNRQALDMLFKEIVFIATRHNTERVAALQSFKNCLENSFKVFFMLFARIHIGQFWDNLDDLNKLTEIIEHKKNEFSQNQRLLPADPYAQELVEKLFMVLLLQLKIFQDLATKVLDVEDKFIRGDMTNEALDQVIESLKGIFDDYVRERATMIGNYERVVDEQTATRIRNLQDRNAWKPGYRTTSRTPRHGFLGHFLTQIPCLKQFIDDFWEQLYRQQPDIFLKQFKSLREKLSEERENVIPSSVVNVVVIKREENKKLDATHIGFIYDPAREGMKKAEAALKVLFYALSPITTLVKKLMMDLSRLPISFNNLGDCKSIEHLYAACNDARSSSEGILKRRDDILKRTDEERGQRDLDLIDKLLNHVNCLTWIRLAKEVPRCLNFIVYELNLSVAETIDYESQANCLKKIQASMTLLNLIRKDIHFKQFNSSDGPIFKILACIKMTLVYIVLNQRMIITTQNHRIDEAFVFMMSQQSIDQLFDIYFKAGEFRMVDYSQIPVNKLNDFKQTLQSKIINNIESEFDNRYEDWEVQFVDCFQKKLDKINELLARATRIASQTSLTH